jgi:hypothetical protein
MVLNVSSFAASFQQACQGLFYYSAWLFDAFLSVNRVNEQNETTTVELNFSSFTFSCIKLEWDEG